MIGLYGLNVLAQFVGDKAALLNWVHRAQPGAMVIMDDPQLAQAVKVTAPDCAVIHRAWNENDHRWHEVTTPANWLTAHRQFAAGGIMLQVFNEPFGYTDLRPLAHWSAELMALAAGEGIRLCLPQWAVGHPDSNRIIAGELDELFHAFHRFPQHILGVHEYAVFSTQDERPFRIGRFLDSLNRIKALGLNPPHIIVSETGRDVGGGIEDGWRSVFTEEQYADFLGGLHDIYTAYAVDCCIFCYGSGADHRWQSFNVENANTLLGKLVAFNGQGVDDMVYVRKPGVTYSLNIRATPSAAAAIVGSIAPSEAVILLEANVDQGWVKIRKNATVGYVSLQTWLTFANQVKIVAA